MSVLWRGDILTQRDEEKKNETPDRRKTQGLTTATISWVMSFTDGVGFSRSENDLSHTRRQARFGQQKSETFHEGT